MAFTGMASAMFLLLEFIITCDEGERFPVRSRKNHRVEKNCSHPSMCRFPQMYLSFTWCVGFEIRRNENELDVNTQVVFNYSL